MVNSIQNNTIYQSYQKVESEKTSQAKPTADTDKNDNKTANKPLYDEYISSEKSVEEASGLYKVVPDENGNTKILYDDPERANESPEKGQEAAKHDDVKPDDSKDKKDKTEKCTINTDRVDREIEKLKEEREKIEQQIKSAIGDEQKIKELESKLTNVQSQLSQKDNDAYRKQNSDVS